MTSWQKLFGFGACVAMFAAACTVSSGTEEDDDVTTGIGGSGSGGTGGSGGTVNDGGSGGTNPTTTTNTATVTSTATVTTTSTSSTTGGGGSGGDEVDCLDDSSGEIPGEVATCETEVDNCCSRCMAANCCEEYSECFAFDPYNICGGADAETSEISAFIDCMLAIGVDEGGSTPGLEEGSDFETCMAEATAYVSDPVCGNGTISGPTNELGVCLHGDEDGLDGCFQECLNADFDDTECTY